jgi:hypothetical protein
MAPHVVHPLEAQTGGSRRVPDLGCEQGGEEQYIPFLRLPHVCASRCEAGYCREGEGRLSCFGQDKLYWCFVTVCLQFPCTARDVLRSGGTNFTTLLHSVLFNIGKTVLKTAGTLWKNSLIVVKYIRIIRVNFIVTAIPFSEKNLDALLSYHSSVYCDRHWAAQPVLFAKYY